MGDPSFIPPHDVLSIRRGAHVITKARTREHDTFEVSHYFVGPARLSAEAAQDDLDRWRRCAEGGGEDSKVRKVLEQFRTFLEDKKHHLPNDDCISAGKLCLWAAAALSPEKGGTR